jgi:hypothetical protein
VFPNDQSLFSIMNHDSYFGNSAVSGISACGFNIYYGVFLIFILNIKGKQFLVFLIQLILIIVLNQY